MLKPLKRRDLIRRLRELVFTGPLSGGRHAFMSKGTLKLRISNPHNEDIGVCLIKEILRQAGVDPRDW